MMRFLAVLASVILGLQTISLAAQQYVVGIVYHDRNQNQTLDRGEKGLKDIRVSNGKDIVLTDKEGRYRIAIDDDTIIFFWGDGGTGWWHGKTLIYDEGVHVPLIVRFPEKYGHLAPKNSGTKNDSIVTLMDLGPSLLSLSGLPIPDYMQGRAFLGQKKRNPGEYAIALRDRFGGCPDFSRSIRDKRYRYIRNFYPQLPYSWWYGLFPSSDRDFAPPAPSVRPDILWQSTKPAEELYDAANDPEMLHNLAGKKEFQRIQEKLRKKLFDWMVDTRDLGLIDEIEMLKRAAGRSPYDVGQECKNFARILETADMSRKGMAAIPELKKRLEDSDSAIRYWATVGLSILGANDPQTYIALKKGLADDSVSVRFAAADALCRLDRGKDAVPFLKTTIEDPDPRTRCRAAFIITSHAGRGHSEFQSLLDPLKHSLAGEKDGDVRMVMESAIYKLENED